MVLLNIFSIFQPFACEVKFTLIACRNCEKFEAALELYN